jgi:hypothetical protein
MDIYISLFFIITILGNIFTTLLINHTKISNTIIIDFIWNYYAGSTTILFPIIILFGFNENTFKTFIWLYLYIFIFDVANCIGGMDEDLLNKNKFLCKNRHYITYYKYTYFISLFIFILYSFYINIFYNSIIWTVCTLIYYIYLYKIQTPIRELFIYFATFCHINYISKVYINIPLKNQLLHSLFMCLFHTIQDVRDIKGDLKINRKTIPILLDNKYIYWYILFNIILQNIIAFYYYNVSLYYWISSSLESIFYMLFYIFNSKYLAEFSYTFCQLSYSLRTYYLIKRYI